MACIPKEHLQYSVLPSCRANGGEVFQCPGELDEVEELLWKAEASTSKNDSKGRTCLIMPHGYKCYEDYYDVLRSYSEKHKGTELGQRLLGLIDRTKALNVKEEWSIARYLGSDYDDDPESLAASLTKGQCYYWPCSVENPRYNGVIDDEEFTSYLYPCDKDCWEVLVDPTGMARRALDGEVDTVSSWKLEFAEDPKLKWMIAQGVRIKEQRMAEKYHRDGWNNSDIDPIELTCPNCGTSYEHPAWTLLNAEEFPSAAERLFEGTLFETQCPSCHETFGVPHPCLYLDPKNNVCIYSVVNERMRAGVVEMFASLDTDADGPKPLRRIVTSRDALREKAIAFHLGMDDRIIELLKFGIRGQAKMKGLLPVDADCDVWLVGTEGDQMLMTIKTDKRKLKSLMPMGAYELYRDAFGESSFVGEQPYFVDGIWAEKVLDAISEEGLI